MKAKKKRLKWGKFYPVLLLSIFFFAINMQVTFASTDTHSINGVNINVSTDKDKYEYGETVNLKISMENTNSYPVSTDNISVTVPNSTIKVGNIGIPSTLSSGQAITVVKPVNNITQPTFEEWTNVDFNGKNYKVGIRAVNNIIEPGSKFIVRSIQKGTAEYDKYWNDLDKKDNVNDLCFLDIGVQKPNGQKYKNLNGYVTVFVQVPDNWEEGSLQAPYISPGEDEYFEESYITIDGIRYFSWSVNHFSPYGVIQAITGQAPADADTDTDANAGTDANTNSSPANPEGTPQKEGSEKESSENVTTGDKNLYILMVLSALVLFFLIFSILCGIRMRKTILSLILCVSLCGLYVFNNNIKDVMASKVSNDSMFTNNISIVGNTIQVNTRITVSYEAPDIIDISTLRDPAIAPYALRSLNSVESQSTTNNGAAILFFNNIPENWTGRLTLEADGLDTREFSISAEDLNSEMMYTVDNLNDDTQYTVTLFDKYNNKCDSNTFIIDLYN